MAWKHVRQGSSCLSFELLLAVLQSLHHGLKASIDALSSDSTARLNILGMHGLAHLVDGKIAGYSIQSYNLRGRWDHPVCDPKCVLGFLCRYFVPP